MSSSASSSAFSAFLLRRVRWCVPLGLLPSWVVLHVALDFVFCGFDASRESSRRPSSLSPSMGCVFRRRCAAGIDTCDFRFGCLHLWRRFGVRPARWRLGARAGVLSSFSMDVGCVYGHMMVVRPRCQTPTGEGGGGARQGKRAICLVSLRLP